MIQVKDVVKSFDGNVVLDHVSANFEDGKVNMMPVQPAISMLPTFRVFPPG